MKTNRVPCFIRKNTPELRAKLEELGYPPVCVVEQDRSLYTKHFENGWFYMGTQMTYWNKSVIDCGENEALFLALAAINDENDYMQWFVFISKNPNILKSWRQCPENNYVQWAKKQRPFLNTYVLAHKANPEELIEHFKNK